MSEATVPLVRAVLKATDICPKISHHVVRAGHGEAADRMHNLDTAVRLINELAGEIELARAVLRRQQASAA
jgi:hypothetical protein